MFCFKLSTCKLEQKTVCRSLFSGRVVHPPSRWSTFSSAYLPTLIFQLPTYVLCDSSTISSLTAIPKSRDFPTWGTWATDGWRVAAHGQGRWLAVRVWRHGIRWGWPTFRQVRCATGSLPLTMLSQPAFLRYTDITISDQLCSIFP